MSGILFLGLALAIFAVGSLVAWLVSRERQTVKSSIEQFQSEMGALKPPTDEPTPPTSPRS